MEKEIIIPRKKSKSIGYAILMLLVTSMFAFLAVIKFANISWINADNVPLLLVILSLICAPICAYCFIHYLKEIFNNNPALIINQNGIHEQLSKFSVGMIKWDDIENINIVPYMDNTYFICILLKNPAKYIENQKRLDKLSKRKSTQKWGHIYFSTLYFKKEFKSVIELIRYYMKENNIISDR